MQLMKKRFDFNRASLSLAAALGIMLVLAFSLVDYPLRMPAISCTFALLCACFLPTPVPVAPGRELALVDGRTSQGWRFYVPRLASIGALGVAGLFRPAGGRVGGQACFPTIMRARADGRRGRLRLTKPLPRMRLPLRTGRRPARKRLAALKLSPIDAVGVRTAAIVRIVGGSPTRGNELMQVATVLGWRDPITQVWAMQASQRSGEPDKVIQRADALYQQEQFLAPSLAILLQDAPNGPTSRALLQALAARPIWRAGFIKASADLPPDYVVKLSQIAAALNTGPAPLSVEEARPLFDRLLAAGDMARAQRLWAGVRRGGYVANGNFEEVSARNGADVPSDWDVGDEDVATIATQVPDFPGDGRALRISSSARSGGDPLAAADADAGNLCPQLSRAKRCRPRGPRPLAAPLREVRCEPDLGRGFRGQRAMAAIQRQVHCANSGLPDPATRSGTAR